MLLDGLGWSHYSVFAPCIMTQTRVLGRSGGGGTLSIVISHKHMMTSVMNRKVQFNPEPS